jgi:hypothetical protein
MGVLEKQLALAIDRRLAVFAGKVRDGSLLSDEMQLRSASYLISEIMLPCCCMMSNKGRLQEVLGSTQVFAGNTPLIEKLATLVYDDLARCNGLG